MRLQADCDNSPSSYRSDLDECQRATERLVVFSPLLMTWSAIEHAILADPAAQQFVEVPAVATACVRTKSVEVVNPVL